MDILFLYNEIKMPRRVSRSRSNSVRPIPIDKKLYLQVVNDAKRTFKVWPSAYASGWVVHEYKRRGGAYQLSRQTSSLKRWFDEKWVDVCYLPKIVPCGRTTDDRNHPYPYCRPLHRITPSTPQTLRELSRNELKSRCRRKRRSPQKRVTSKKK